MTRHISIGTAWAEAAAGLRRERRLVAPVALGLMLLPSVLSAMVQPATVASDNDPPAWRMVAMFAILLVTIVGQMAIVLLVDGWRGSVGQAIARAVRRLPPLLLAGLMLMLPLFVLLAVAGGLGGVRADPAKMSGGAAAVILLFMALMAFVAIRLLPMVAFAATTDAGAVALLRRTWRATHGHFWKLFGFFLMWLIAFLIVAFATTAVVGSIVMLAFGRPEAWSVSLLTFAFVTGLVQAVFMTIYSAMLARIAAQLDGAPGSDSTSGT